MGYLSLLSQGPVHRPTAITVDGVKRRYKGLAPQRRTADLVSYYAWQRKRHAQESVAHREWRLRTMADSTKQLSTAEAAWTFETVEQFETWLTQEYHATDGKTGKPLYWDKPEGEKNRKAGTEATQYPVMRLPSPPNVGANISPEWQFKVLHHPLARQHTEYSEDLARMSRYGTYLILAEIDGQLKVPEGVRKGFETWYQEYEAERSASLTAARAGATQAMQQAKQAVGALNAQQQRVAQMLKDGLISQELADAILGAADGQSE